MKNRKSNIMNNSGSTMIIVIVCVGFISIISSLLLITTVNNIQMKAINQRSKSNFYSAEIALSEIRAGVEEVTAKAMEVAYNKVMEKYLDDSVDKESLFSETFTEEIAKTLGNGIILNYYDISKLAAYIKNPEAMLITDTDLDENQLIIDGTNAGRPKYITIKNVHISYVDAKDYKTTLSTDIKISVPGMDIQAATRGTNVYADYGLIADKSITLLTANNVNIQGNTYAGAEGIRLENASFLNMSQGSNIITRGNIEVLDRSKLQIQDNPNIWAKNLITAGTSPDTEAKTTIDIEGNCFIENDLLLNARKSQVTVKGEYYGYGNELNPNNSSAVIINGLKSTLDLSGLSRLLIAGRAYLDPKTSGNQYNATEQGEIQTGESLAVKGNQYAYLVPTECLWRDTSYTGIDPKQVSNPVSFELYEKRRNNTDGLPAGTPMVSLTSEIRNYANGYTEIFYNNGTRQEVFFFLTFDSPGKANEYLKYYYESQRSLTESNMEARIKSFANSLTLNTASSMILSPGHLLSYTDVDGVGLEESTTAPDGTSLNSMTANFKSRYKVLSEELSEISRGGALDTNSVYRSLVNDSLITAGMNKVYNVDGYKGYVVDGNYNTIPGTKGIIIATGDVTVNGDYTGLILAGGKVILTNESSVTASGSIVNHILNKNTELNSYLRNVTVSSVGGTGGSISGDRIIVSDLIGYERWKMNED
ncbi:hypothetical protein EDD66_102295 [Mobilisporobacter senegalensis]|uniref:Uncharacterized protein n=1 Tax=Mobilisporobacter senegalensis TaxID=1329262 RepID=A0A3N1XWQ7_9FIRM|nr:hypothetical protein [Mobilisporobacter senegalensis]ROR30641.1 hypothetical protein EDD66_102295 [Mobilisporobacter senegalensis]